MIGCSHRREMCAQLETRNLRISAHVDVHLITFPIRLKVSNETYEGADPLRFASETNNES